MTIAQTIPDAKAIIVTTPQEVSLADVRKSISFCKTVKMEIYGMVENMSGFECPHCGENVDIFGSGGGERTAAAAGIRFLGKVPFDQKVVSCGDTGTSIQATYAIHRFPRRSRDCRQGCRVGITNSLPNDTRSVNHIRRINDVRSTNVARRANDSRRRNYTRRVSHADLKYEPQTDIKGVIVQFI